ncbi:pseudaminic acid cytidylyltransferase [Pectinatus frisingensis]|uniref:pseudaminic acid cytidylyltransferase n=1 Tax=Pectinatus frisingensis TaxID=865 RepID=UPI0018C66922|nr:pseudaminic acid cytidylyltransferase [Pectinatus frisingensis]
MNNICIITARGGSKRIPRKNIKNFCGKPILAYSIEAALESRIFDEVMVSTDDAEITEIAVKYGAKVPFVRSSKNSDDHATTADVLEEVVNEYKKCNKTFKYMCCIYPTAPFVTAEKLRKSFAMLQNSGADAIIPVVKYSFPPQRCFVVENEKLLYKWPEYMRTRSQDLTPYYHDAGQFYFIKMSVFERHITLVPDNTIAFPLDEMEVQDIDNLTDWQLAELKYQLSIDKNK